ncbi:hemerythrin domain-containing protein [Nocardioides sp. JQ2195]|uniref:hemerythrin domain-containing protein n=1 Tax=Nocardioides sp. JQ2195 TaxID=2592334 RepID=UPI00143E8640|nr:hemerythrin domain-containing protein [Nocardioides sp. JQ2195]QIX27575.1 hemerythrin domain-containing protein [Nocardioides sp. JQ2195]
MSQDVIDLIMQDHREVERMFEQLKTQPDSRAGLTPVLVTLLAAHSRAEEAEVYPAARDEAGAAEDVEHSQEEHLLADRLLAELSECDPTSSAYDAKLAEVVDAVTHHVQEEESTVLPDMRTGLDETRRAALGEAFLRSRQSHLGDMPQDITMEEMRQQAANADIPVGDRDKQALESELDKHADK